MTNEPTDGEVLAFVYWCRINAVPVVTNVATVRRMLRSYNITPTPRPRSADGS